MVIRGTLANGAALLVSFGVSATIIGTIGLGVSVVGAPALTVALAFLGTLFGVPTMIGGLLGLLLLQVVVYLVCLILFNLMLAWVPV